MNDFESLVIIGRESRFYSIREECGSLLMWSITQNSEVMRGILSMATELVTLASMISFVGLSAEYNDS